MLPTLGLEAERLWPVALVALHSVGWDRGHDVTGDEDIVDHEALWGGHTAQAARDRGPKAEGLVDDPVEVGNSASLLIGPVTVAIWESLKEGSLERLVAVGVLDKVV